MSSCIKFRQIFIILAMIILVFLSMSKNKNLLYVQEDFTIEDIERLFESTTTEEATALSTLQTILGPDDLTDEDLLTLNSLHPIDDTNTDDTNTDDTNKKVTLLYKYAEKGWSQIVGYLISKGANIIVSEQYSSPLHVACYLGNIDLLRVLLKNTDINVNALDSNEKTPLHYACDFSKSNTSYMYYRRKQCIDELLNHNNIDVNLVTDTGYTPLHILLDSENFASLDNITIDYNLDIIIGICDSLIYNNADLTIKTLTNNDTPLHFASGWPSSVESLLVKLIDNGAEVNTPNSSGQIPLVLAIKSGNYNNVQILIDNNSDIDFQNYDNSEYYPTALFYVKDVLLDSSSYNIANKDCSMIDNDITCNMYYIMQLLIDTADDAEYYVQRKDDYQKSVIYYLDHRHYEYAKLLLESGANFADLNVDGDGLTQEDLKKLEIYISECYNRIQQLEMSHSDELNVISGNYKEKIEKRNRFIESLKRQRNESYDTIRDLKDMELLNETKKTHDAFQKLEQYEKKTKTFRTANNILFGILLILIFVCLLIYIYKNYEKVEKIVNTVQNIARYKYSERHRPIIPWKPKS